MNVVSVRHQRIRQTIVAEITSPHDLSSHHRHLHLGLRNLHRIDPEDILRQHHQIGHFARRDAAAIAFLARDMGRPISVRIDRLGDGDAFLPLPTLRPRRAIAAPPRHRGVDADERRVRLDRAVGTEDQAGAAVQQPAEGIGIRRTRRPPVPIHDPHVRRGVDRLYRRNHIQLRQPRQISRVDALYMLDAVAGS